MNAQLTPVVFVSGEWAFTHWTLCGVSSLEMATPDHAAEVYEAVMNDRQPIMRDGQILYRSQVEAIMSLPWTFGEQETPIPAAGWDHLIMRAS